MKRNLLTLSLTLVVLLTIIPFAHAQPDPQALKEWKDQKYTMFIHWGLYSVPGGVWDGNNLKK